MFFVWVRMVFSDTDSCARDVGAAEIAAEQPEHVELAVAQRLDRGRRAARPGVRGPRRRRQQPADVRGGARRFGSALSRAAIGGPSSANSRT